jgi:hypothetical protein
VSTSSKILHRCCIRLDLNIVKMSIVGDVFLAINNINFDFKKEFLIDKPETCRKISRFKKNKTVSIHFLGFFKMNSLKTLIIRCPFYGSCL